MELDQSFEISPLEESRHLHHVCGHCSYSTADKSNLYVCPKQYSFLRSQWGWHGSMIYLACTSILHTYMLLCFILCQRLSISC